MTLIIDTRERGACHKKIAKEIPSEYRALDAGDYLIPKDDNFILIERSTYADFISKIASGRLWKQMNKCLEVSDDVYFVLENPFMIKFSRMSVQSIMGAMVALSRNVKIITTRSQAETRMVISSLYHKYNSDRKIDFAETRVKAKTRDVKEMAEYCLMGIHGVGSNMATRLLAERSIADLCQMSVDELSVLVPLKKAKLVHKILHGDSHINAIE